MFCSGGGGARAATGRRVCVGEIEWLADTELWNRARMHCLRDRLAAGHQPVTIAAYGSSITAGNGWQESYPEKLARALQERFPRSNATVLNFGYPGSSLGYLGACLDRLLPVRAADLYIVEVLDVDEGGRAGQRLTILREAEELLFALYEREPRSQVLLLVPFSPQCAKLLWSAPSYADRTRLERVRRLCFSTATDDSTAAGAEAFGSAHGIPVASVRREAPAALLRAQLNDSAASSAPLADRHNRSVALLTSWLDRTDLTHPTAGGLDLIVRAIVRSIEGLPTVAGAKADADADASIAAANGVNGATIFDTTTTDAASGIANGTASSAAVDNVADAHVYKVACHHEHTAAASSTNWSRAWLFAAPRPRVSRICAFGEQLQPLVMHSNGWLYRTEQSRHGRPKPGYIATRPAAVLELCAVGEGARLPGFLQLKRGPLEWQFGYLASYEAMGTVTATCVRGCACRPTNWSGHITQRVSLTRVASFPVQVCDGGNALAVGSAGNWTTLPRALQPRGECRHVEPTRPTDRMQTMDVEDTGSGTSSGCSCVVRLTVSERTESRAHKFKVIASFSGFHMYDPGYALHPDCAQAKGAIAGPATRQRGRQKCYNGRFRNDHTAGSAE